MKEILERLLKDMQEEHDDPRNESWPEKGEPYMDGLSAAMYLVRMEIEKLDKNR